MRVAIVGCGGIARMHAASIAALPEVELVALADVRPEALVEFGRLYGVPTTHHFTDYTAMYEKAKPDVVAVCTRPAQHHAPTVAALARRIHVLCEKPMALDLEQADEMIATSERTGAKLAINTQRHTDPIYRHTARLVRDGVIGDLRMVRSECKGCPATIGMMDMGPHWFDAMSLFAGPAEWVFARLSNANGAEATPADVEEGDRGSGLVAGNRCTVHIGYRNGVIGISEYWAGVPTFGFEVVGTRGALTIQANELQVTKRNATVSEPVEIALAVDERKSLETAGRWATLNMMRALVQAIRDDARPECSGYDGRAALEVIMAAYTSHKSGELTRLPLRDRRHPLSAWK